MKRSTKGSKNSIKVYEYTRTVVKTPTINDDLRLLL